MIQSGVFSLKIIKSIGILRIEREDKRNALDAHMMNELGAICREIECNKDILVLILTGVGKSFCSGGDINAWCNYTPLQFARHWIRDGHESFDRLARLRQPVIAAINGHVFGGGLELAACADYRIAEDHVEVGQPECSLGIIAGWSGTQRVSRRFGSQVVRRMAIFGDVLSANKALAEGVVDEVVGQGASLDRAMILATAVIKRGPLATELTKMLINAAEGEERERVLEAFAGHIAASSGELAEGISAYQDKRSPKFKRKKCI